MLLRCYYVTLTAEKEGFWRVSDKTKPYNHAGYRVLNDVDNYRFENLSPLIHQRFEHPLLHVCWH